MQQPLSEVHAASFWQSLPSAICCLPIKLCRHTGHRNLTDPVAVDVIVEVRNLLHIHHWPRTFHCSWGKVAKLTFNLRS